MSENREDSPRLELPLAGSPFSRGRRALRSLVLLLLLFGPLTAAELWARGQLDLLYPYIVDRAYWSETKVLLLERAGCPQVLGLGSSVTNRTFAKMLAEGEQLVFADGPGPVEAMFAFGLVGGRMSQLYGAWRHIAARGCVPDYLFLEVTPVLIRKKRANAAAYKPYLDAMTLWHLPDGFVAEVGLDRDRAFELVTWDRSLLSRLRVEFLRAFRESLGLQPFTGSREPLALDGAVMQPLGYTLLEGRFEKERRKRSKGAKSGRYDVTLSEVHAASLPALVAEASAAGATVVLHTPPVTSIYRNIGAKAGGNDALCDLYRDVTRGGSVLWHFAYDSNGYGAAHFTDWVHLNRDGAQRYIGQLFAAVRSGKYRRPVRVCRSR